MSSTIAIIHRYDTSTWRDIPAMAQHMATAEGNELYAYAEPDRIDCFVTLGEWYLQDLQDSRFNAFIGADKIEFIGLQDSKDTLYLYDSMIEGLSFEGFDWKNYWESEKEILQPQLEALGLTVEKWFNGETDSWGPLSRVALIVDAYGQRAYFIYG